MMSENEFLNKRLKSILSDIDFIETQIQFVKHDVERLYEYRINLKVVDEVEE